MGLGKFESVQPGKHIWFVHAAQSRLPSVIVMRLKHPDTVNFKYLSDASEKISLDFKAGRKHLRDLPVTAAGFTSAPHMLNESFQARIHATDHLFILGLARAERRGPEGYNRLPECSEALLRQLDVESFAEYCQLLVIGILEVPRAEGPLQPAFHRRFLQEEVLFTKVETDDPARSSKRYSHQTVSGQTDTTLRSLPVCLASAWRPTLEGSAAARRLTMRQPS